MKNKIISLIILSSLFIVTFAGKKINEPAKPSITGHITISGAFALYPMAVRWADEFKKINPGVKIDISAGGAGKGMTDVLSGTADIGMVSREINPEETKKGAFPVAVTKDAVLPTISAANPNLNELLKKGMKKQGFIDLWVTGKSKTWGQAAGIKANTPPWAVTDSGSSEKVFTCTVPR